MVVNRQQKWPLFFMSLIPLLLLGIYLYKNVLPYHFSPQWQPTAMSLNNTGKYDHAHEEGIFLGQKVRSSDISRETKKQTFVLGEADTAKRIEVDLTNQKSLCIRGKQQNYGIYGFDW